jgi:hypothetical protein
MQEDKYMANQLDNLNSLPEGYQANISSKWEMIEMGMNQKRNRFPVYWMMAAAACFLLMIGAGYFYFIGKEQNKSVAKIEVKKEAGTIAKQAEQTTNQIPTTIVKVSTNKNIVNQKQAVQNTIIAIAHSTSDTIASSSNIPTEAIVQHTVKQELASTIDSSSSVASTVSQPTTKKNKQRYFQMDFGEGTPNDPIQKTASNKIFQFRLSSKTQSDGNPSSTKTGMPKLVQPL